MKTRNSISKLLTRTVAVAALVAAGVLSGGGWLQPVKAQTGNDSVSIVSYATIGIVDGEKVRLSVANTKESGGDKSGGTLSLSFSYYLAHGTNSWSSDPLYESGWTEVPSREIWSSGFSREDLKTEGEPETRRAEVLVKVSMIAPAGSDPEDYPASLEIFKDELQGGESVETDSKYRLILLAARRSKPLNVPVSFGPGERLDYSFFNPNEEGSRSVSVTTYTYDTCGNLVSQTDPVVLRPGDGHTFVVKRDDLRVVGEERTGRLLVRTELRVSSMDGSVLPVKLHVSMEHVNRAGGSIDGNYFTGSVTVSGDG